MATNDEPTTDEQPEAWRTEPGESVADVEPPAEYLDEFPRWNGRVDVVIPKDVARAIAHRVGARAATGDTVTERTVYDFAYDHAQVADGSSSLPATGGSRTSRSLSGSNSRAFRSTVPRATVATASAPERLRYARRVPTGRGCPAG